MLRRFWFDYLHECRGVFYIKGVVMNNFFKKRTLASVVLLVLSVSVAYAGKCKKEMMNKHRPAMASKKSTKKQDMPAAKEESNVSRDINIIPSQNVDAVNVNASNNVTVGNQLSTNTISPTSACGMTTVTGNIAVASGKRLLVDTVAPGAKAAVTVFNGNLAVNPDKAIWVNTINPVKLVGATVAGTGKPLLDPCTKKQVFNAAANDSCGARVNFGGGIKVGQGHIIDHVDGVTIDSNSSASCTKGISLDFSSSTCVAGAYVKLWFVGTATSSGTSPHCIDLMLTDEMYVYPGMDPQTGLGSNLSLSALSDGISLSEVTCFTRSGNVVNLGIGFTATQSSVNVSYSALGTLYYEVYSIDTVTVSCATFPCNAG